MKIVITNVFGHGNRGDAALLQTLCRSLHEAFPGADLHGITNYPSAERNVLPAVMWHEAPGHADDGPFQRVFNALLLVAYAIIIFMRIPSRYALFIPSAQRSGLRAIETADLVISCPGGFLLDINLHFLVDMLQLHYAVSRRVPVVLAPQTIGPIRRKIAKHWLRSVLSQCKLICAREMLSVAFLKNDLDLERNVIFFPDLAFLFWGSSEASGPKIAHELGLGSTPFLAVSILWWEFPGRPDQPSAQETYEVAAARAISLVAEELKLTVLIVNQVSTDLPSCHRVASLCSARVVVDEIERSPQDIKALIGEADAMIASRFHSCIFAILEHIPVVAISYTYKTDGIMSWLGRTADTFDINTFSSDDLAARLIELRRDHKLGGDIDSRISSLWNKWQDILCWSALDKGISPIEIGL